MKSTAFFRNGRLPSQVASAKRFTTGLALTMALGLTHQAANAALTVDLLTATDFAVLAGSAISFAAPVNSTVITGDIGSYPTSSITGTENLVLIGVNHGGDGVTQQAKIDLGSAYTDAAGRPLDVLFPLIHDVGGDTLIAGVYNAPSSLAINGVLTLDGEGDSNAVWIFQTGSTLDTGSASSVVLINGARASNVFWQVGSSATLGTGSQFQGTIMALTSITLTTNATITGRALAINGAVTMDNNSINIPETGSSMLCALGLTLATLNRRRKA